MSFSSDPRVPNALWDGIKAWWVMGHTIDYHYYELLRSAVDGYHVDVSAHIIDLLQKVRKFSHSQALHSKIIQTTLSAAWPLSPSYIWTRSDKI